MKTADYVDMYIDEGVRPFLQPHVAKLVDAARQADDAFSPAAIDQAARDQERFDAGWNAGYDAAEAKRMPIVEAYALVAADLEREGLNTCDHDVVSAVFARLAKMEEGA